MNQATVKSFIQNLFLMSLLAGLGLMSVGQATAQTFTNLYTFTGGTNAANPYASLILSGNTLYGTTFGGGKSGSGTIFAVNTNGMDFTNLYNFTALVSGTNSDGALPEAGLILSGNTLYGTATSGGVSGLGTVFAINTDGSGFRVLPAFTLSVADFPDGATPASGLILSGNTLYGTALNGGGSSGSGTVFAVNTNGTGFTNIYVFTFASGDSKTNSDGALPQSVLVLSGNTLYGTARGGGTSGNGTVFAVNTDGTSFTNLHTFTGSSDGAEPLAGLILLGNTLYGTTARAGTGNSGTVFAVNTDGTGFTNLYSFTATSGYPYYTNSDGANPIAGLILSGNTLYGTAAEGGSGQGGTVFAINTDGTRFTDLHTFSNGDYDDPNAGLVLSDNILYGTTFSGGSGTVGTIFSLTLPVIIVTWPTNNTGFTLQSTTNLVSPAVWSTNLSSPAIVNGQNTVTNPISGTQQFFRLWHP
jgi:uncharacterized repeat protein (TIGR03803 family)